MPLLNPEIEINRCTAFQGTRLLSSGPLLEVALATQKAIECDGAESVLIFNDTTGRTIELDLRGTGDDVTARLTSLASVDTNETGRFLDPASKDSSASPRGPGRPKLGVIGREVTLLPRQWEWLNAQPSGASVALRRLVDEARRSGSDRQEMRSAQERAYNFMYAMAGNFPGFEEAARALFANDRNLFEKHVASWPEDVRSYAKRLAFSQAISLAWGIEPPR